MLDFCLQEHKTNKKDKIKTKTIFFFISNTSIDRHFLICYTLYYIQILKFYYMNGDFLIMDKKEQFVEHIAKRDEDFSQWYTDVVKQADLMDYSPVRGCMVIKPYGYAIWEMIQEFLNNRIKETGHKNAYFPLLIPESLLQKEIDHVEGFAPEVAWVTHAGDKELEERLCIRPTSETIICSMFAKWLKSYRDLPYLYNQWCSVVRWEMTTRPFLRTSEFLWQEGHTLHETHEEAYDEVMQMLAMYVELAEDILAIPVVQGEKSETERFAGAAGTYTMEALMQDGKALQLATSHDLGQHFSKVYDIEFSGRDGKLHNPYQTSWGITTRTIGGLIMVHGDDRGLALPPNIAPVQVVIIPVAAHKAGVVEECEKIYTQLKLAGIRVELDDRDKISPGFKFNEWELKGVPVRLEIGPRDIENGIAIAVRRDNFDKSTIPFTEITTQIKDLLEQVQQGMFDKARKHLLEHTLEANNFETFEKHIASESGFVKAMWCGDAECEDQIKEKTGATTRCAPFDQENLGETCVHCGKPAKKMMYFAKAY